MSKFWNRFYAGGNVLEKQFADSRSKDNDSTMIISARNIHKRYEQGSNQLHILRGVDLDIHEGEVLALVGPSGCGKSTALAVLERFIDVDAGSVWVESNGSQVELREYAIDAWRRAVAWVGQDPTMVSGSLADNVRLANSSASDSDVLRALEVVGLTHLVAELPDGIATVLGEGGRALSAGQARRVALARAFCQQAGLVLLDEPTAALDVESEALVIAAVAELAKTRTVLVVAHRPALVELADHVVDLAGVPV